MRRRLGPLIRLLHHSMPHHLIPQELSTAFWRFLLNPRLLNLLNMSEGHTLSATIRNWSPSVATKVSTEDRRCNECAVPLNSLKLDDHSCLADVVTQPRSNRRQELLRVLPEVISPALKRNGIWGISYDLRTARYSSGSISGCVL